MEENHTPDTDPPSFSSEFDSIAIPPPPFCYSFYNSSSDQTLLGNSISDLSFSIDGDVDFGLTFDDLYFPSENESFLIPVDATNREISGDFTPALGGISGDCGNDRMNTNCAVSPTDSYCSDTAQSLSLSTTDCVADVSEATIASSSSPESGKVVVDQKLKVEEEEEEATTCETSTTKRKKENEDEDTSEESRSNKYMRPDEEDDDEKRNARIIRNRESAQLSRQRKKHYVEELEDKVKNLRSLITDLSSKVSYFMAENATLREKVGPGKNMSWPRHQPPSPPGMYPPLAPMDA